MQSGGLCECTQRTHKSDMRMVQFGGNEKMLFLSEEASVNTTCKEQIHKPQQSSSVLTALAHITLRDQLKWTQTQYSGGQAKCI